MAASPWLARRAARPLRRERRGVRARRRLRRLPAARRAARRDRRSSSTRAPRRRAARPSWGCWRSRSSCGGGPDTRVVLFGDTKPPPAPFTHEFAGVLEPPALARPLQPGHRRPRHLAHELLADAEGDDGLRPAGRRRAPPQRRSPCSRPRADVIELAEPDSSRSPTRSSRCSTTSRGAQRMAEAAAAVRGGHDLDGGGRPDRARAARLAARALGARECEPRPPERRGARSRFGAHLA